MAYKDKEDMNTYLKNRYYQKKKWAFEILGNKCSGCGGKDGLEIDHINPDIKKFNVSVFLRSRTEQELLKELKKCQLLCGECHKKKTKTQKINEGEKNPSAKIKETDIINILKKLENGNSLRKIAKEYGVSHVTILGIKKNKTWKNIRRVDRVV